MKNKEYQSIIKMIEYINRAEQYTKDLSIEDFSKDMKTIDATVLVISQIGELVKNFDKDFQTQNSNIEWIVIKNLRNKIIHDYEGIKLNLIGDIIKEDIPKLKQDLNNILKNDKKD